MIASLPSLSLSTLLYYYFGHNPASFCSSASLSSRVIEEEEEEEEEISEEFMGSPCWRHQYDVEAGRRHRYDDDDEDTEGGPFDIPNTKTTSSDCRRRWRKATFVLNSFHRFRYTLDLKKEEEKQQIPEKIRTHTGVVEVAVFLQNAGSQLPAPGIQKRLPAGDFDIGPEQLASMLRDQDFDALQNYGGAKGLADKLKSNAEKGIPGEEADLLQRKHIFGSNTYPWNEGPNFWRCVLDACDDPTLIILMSATVAFFALGIKTEGIKEGWHDGGTLALAVIIVIVVPATSDYVQSLQFQSINEEKHNVHVEVIRGGRRVQVSIFEIVVGDVIPFKTGDQVPADGVLIFGHSLSLDESTTTGESKIVRKDLKAPFLLSGCKVADGYGTMLVIGVGMASISEVNDTETPLQVHLNGIATVTGTVSLAVAFVVLVVLSIRYFTGHTTNPDGSVQFRAGETEVSVAIYEAVKILTVAVTIVIVAVPEGLPLAVTLTLAYSMRKMMRDKALVRRRSACETMGFVTTICCDKTMNMMTVVEALVSGKKVEPVNNSSSLPTNVTSLLIEAIAQNTIGNVFLPEGNGDIEVTGSPIEKAILQWGVNIGMKFEAVRSSSSIIHASVFNSEKKRGGVAVRTADSEVHIHWKGAAEIVLASCTRYIDANGQLVKMDNDQVTSFKNSIEDMAARSLHCVAFAFRSCETEDIPTIEEELEYWNLPENDLVLLAIVGLKNSCQLGAKDAVQLCQNAGVTVRMVTGDNLRTAKAIALECGILNSDADATEPILIEGTTFRAMTEVQRQDVAEKILVMGMSSPDDKLWLVQALKKRGHVVAVNGDGTNDAPALREADVGLAMGIQGTVAKESSDIIILDDNFASVAKGIRWGRSVYANIQKFIQFQLPVNVAALIINLLAATYPGDLPLNAVQLLWVNLIMDTLGTLALTTEPLTEQLMTRPPVGRREPLITSIMWKNIFIQTLYQVVVLLVLNSCGESILNLEHDMTDHANKVLNTLMFNVSVFCQIFNMFNARKPDEINVFKGVTKNPFFMGIVGLTVVLQVLIIMFLGKFTSSVRLNWQLWVVSIVIGVLSCPLAAIGKLVPEKPIIKFFTRKLYMQINLEDSSNGGQDIELQEN